MTLPSEVALASLVCYESEYGDYIRPLIAKGENSSRSLPTMMVNFSTDEIERAPVAIFNIYIFPVLEPSKHVERLLAVPIPEFLHMSTTKAIFWKQRPIGSPRFWMSKRDIPHSLFMFVMEITSGGWPCSYLWGMES